MVLNVLEFQVGFSELYALRLYNYCGYHFGLLVSEKVWWRKILDNPNRLFVIDIDVFAFLSLWIVWIPLITSLTYHDGEYQGIPPLSKLSYPIFLSVYHTPHLDLRCDKGYSGIVSFKIFFANIKICEINGSFSYPSAFGEFPLNYKINLPFFETKEKFFAFLLATFTNINLAGAAIGILTYSTVKRIRKSKTLT
jgi:hypothetical protein